jgi:hypothetical protein
VFYYASSFDQPLVNWEVVDLVDIFTGSGCPGEGTLKSCFYVKPILVFETREELREVVISYLANGSKNTVVARAYGWPISVWDVSKIQDFSDLFSPSDDSGRFNPAFESFNEDISGSLGNWDVSRVQDMFQMFDASGCPAVAGQQSCFYV